MHSVTRSELEAQAPAWDDLVPGDALIDPFCARSAWQLAFHDAFEPGRRLWFDRSERGCVVLAESTRRGPVGLLEPLENMWGFGSPLIGEEAPALLARALRRKPRPVLLLGLPADRRRLAPLIDLVPAGFQARSLEATIRFVASLDGGIEGWLARRRPAFRRNLRASVRRGENAGIRFRRIEKIGAGELAGAYATVLEVERRSWKSLSGRGADGEPMRSFYSGLWPRLVDQARLDLLLAEHDGRPIGYLHGARVGGHFRGLQFSFDETWRAIGLGNLLQFEMLKWLCEDGAARYDLGGQSAYKGDWAEPGPEGLSLLLLPATTAGRRTDTIGP